MKFVNTTLMSAASLAIATGCFCNLASGQVAPGWTLTRVVDSQTTLPGVQGVVSQFTPYANMLSGSTFAFSTSSGIYQWNEGVLSVIVDTSTPLPNFAVMMTEFGPPYIDGDSVYFVAAGVVEGVTKRGVYKATAGEISVVADTTTVAPHGSPFTEFSDGLGSGPPSTRIQYVSADHGVVAFSAFEVDRRGLYLAAPDGTITTAADSLTAFPRSTSFPRQFLWPTVEGTDVVFGCFSPVQGVFARVGGSPVTILRNGEPAPGGGLFGSGLGTPKLFNGQALFWAVTSTTGAGIYHWNGASIDLVVNRNSSLPGEAAPLVDIGGFAFNRGRTAIVARRAASAGDVLFVQMNGQWRRVADSAGQIDGRDVDSLYIETPAFDRRSLVFTAFFSDATFGLYRVQPTCLADWNIDGASNSQDFFDFLSSLFAGDADFNQNDATNSQDFFDFLNAFFEGC